MVNILCIDFSSEDLVIAASAGGKRYALMLEAQKQSSEKVWEVLNFILGSMDKKMKDVEFLGLGLGPGYFTGLRVSLSIVKAFSLACGAKIVTVPSYDIRAHSLPGVEKLCVCFDARKNLFYAACYENKKGKIQKTSKEKLIDYKYLKNLINRGYYICGDVSKMLLPAERRKAKIVPESFWNINPYVFMDLCLEKVKKRRFTNSKKVDVLYVHPQTCQVRR